MNVPEALGQGRPAGRDDGALLDQAVVTPIGVDDPVTRALGARVDAEDQHAFGRPSAGGRSLQVLR